MTGTVPGLFVCLCFAAVHCQILSPNNTLRCRLCNRASTLSDCNKLVTCDPTVEECYMDQVVTEQLTVVYDGGCRAKSVCARTFGRRRREGIVGCSRCCNSGDDCNKRLCAIPDDTLTSSQCYSCDHRNSDQSEVRNPQQCVSLTTCQQDEVCYATQSDVAGTDTFFYGCQNLLMCKILMQNAYQEYLRCVKNDTNALHGTTCGFRARATHLCHSCCGDGACNYGTCRELNDNIFKLADLNLFDWSTLKKK